MSDELTLLLKELVERVKLIEQTVYKADKLTGGHASDAVGNVKQNVQQAGGPSGIFSKMYQNYKNK